jgi:hypothetical protein
MESLKQGNAAGSHGACLHALRSPRAARESRAGRSWPPLRRGHRPRSPDALP